MKSTLKFIITSIFLFFTISTSNAKNTWIFDFEACQVGKIPPQFYPEKTGKHGKIAIWKVIRWHKAPSGEKVVAVYPDPRSNWGNTFNLLILKDVKLKNLEASVYIKAIKGREDQGGGILWRALDKNNYYVVRWNPLEDNFRLYFVKNGHRKMLASSYLKADPERWHGIKVVQEGNLIKCFFDGKLKISIKDTTFKGKGYIGLWTKSDACSAFDLLIIKKIGSQH